LDERTDRWIHSQKQFEILGIANKVQRFSAIKPEYDDRWNRSTGWGNPWRYPLLGAVGCAESHKAIIKIAKENQYENVMVFEDDFYVNKNWNENLSNALGDLKNIQYDIFYLGYHLNHADDLIINISENLKKCMSKKKRGIHRTLALSYNNSVYNRLISDIDSFNWKRFGREGHVDKYYAKTKQIKKYFVSPPVVSPDHSFESDIS
jgi:GR25 family glycosyltransferase involved in LPS biosynthesis